MSRGLRSLRVYGWLLLTLLYLPIGVVVVQSFNQSRYGVQFTGFTLDWYARLLTNQRLLEYLGNTLVLALVSTLLATALGTLLALGLARYRFKLRPLLQTLLYLPVVLPDVVMGIALLLMFSFLRQELGFPRLSLWTVILAHVSFQLAYVTLVVRARLTLLDPALEEAARDLGANELRTFRHVTLPLIAPGVLSGALLAFTLSLDDFVITFFTAGSGSTTLPLYIYSAVRLGVTPEVHALSTLLLGFTLLALLLAQRLWRRR
jgi:spermidine/putrescine transport system permease protein